jgi:hypothetical protein
MGHEQALQSGALWQTRELMSIVTTEPAVKCSEMVSFQGKQYADGDKFAWIQFRLAVLGHRFHLIVDTTKNLNDKIYSRHEDPPLC